MGKVQRWSANIVTPRKRQIYSIHSKYQCKAIKHFLQFLMSDDYPDTYNAFATYG